MSDHKPVTAEELASVDAQAEVAMASAERIDLNLEGFDDCTEVGDMARVQDVIKLAPRLARDLATAQASIRGLIESLNAAQTDRDAIGDRCLDLGRELEALRAAVRAHREATKAGRGPWTGADLRLWNLAKVTP